MPITDTDLIIVRKATRTGQNNIEIEFEWKDAQGVSKGVHGISWSTFEEMVGTVEEQNLQDVIRVMVSQLINRSTGGFRGALFDSLPGKQFEIMQRVREIT